MTNSQAPSNSNGLSRRDRGLLWYGLIGGPLAWLLHLLSTYVIGEFGCLSYLEGKLFLGMTMVAWMVIAVSLLLFAPALAATLAARRYVRRLQDSEDDDSEAGPLLLAQTGFIASGIATLTIFVESVPVLYYLRDC